MEGGEPWLPCLKVKGRRGYQFGLAIGQRFARMIQSRFETDVALHSDMLPFAATEEGQKLLATLSETNRCLHFYFLWETIVCLCNFMSFKNLVHNECDECAVFCSELSGVGVEVVSSLRKCSKRMSSEHHWKSPCILQTAPTYVGTPFQGPNNARECSKFYLRNTILRPHFHKGMLELCHQNTILKSYSHERMIQITSSEHHSKVY